ncbi:cytochrome P450 [Streptomyces sp. TRM49041]|uniref:cytochrome P450 n=1 Tax=Streptomyces sp. TRM49041 TaxID=2603216 RepID=UPI0011EBBAA5|nr:cytochrome P450 [Streptomyces sp. TRM49041]
MTVPSSDHTTTDPGLTPPPGCPAHTATGAGGVARLYGPAAETDPMGLYEKLRAAHGPVAPVLLEGDVRSWLVLGYMENRDVASRATQFTRDSRIWHGWTTGEIDTTNSPLLPLIAWRPDCACADGDDHQRLRGAVTASLDQFDQRGVRRHITRFAHQLIDEFCADGKAELIDQFTEHLPMLVLTHLLGMPDAYGPKLVRNCRDLIKGSADAVALNAKLVETLEQLVAAKRVMPGHDVASVLMSHEARLSDEEVLHHLRLMLLAGYETTVNLMANVLRMVVIDPRFRGSLAGGQMTLPEAVEQVLWDEPPLMVTPARWATGDTTLGGQEIKAGDMLMLGLAAGNADQVIRPSSSTRVHHNRAHLAFSTGTHECPGQDIARVIADTGIDILLTRLPDINLAIPEEELTWRSSTWARHLTALPVKFAPRTAEARDVLVPLPAPPVASSAMPPEQRCPVPEPDPTARPEPRASWRARLMRFLRRR